MRRNDREISDPETLRAVMDHCRVCRLGLCDGSRPYIVPMSFGYAWDDQGLSIYLHSAHQGRKLDILRRNPSVCIELDRPLALVTGERACEWSLDYESVIGEGTASLLTDPAERIAGLERIMLHYSGRSDWPFDAAQLAATAVIRVRVESVSGKRRRG